MINLALRQNFQRKLVDYFFKAKVTVGLFLLACAIFFHYFQVMRVHALPVIVTLLVEVFLFALYYLVRSRRPEWALHYNIAGLWIDILAVTIGVHYIGGIYSMMWTVPYLLLIGIASLFLSRKGRVLYSAYVFLCYTFLFQLERSGVLDRHNVFRIPPSGSMDLFCWTSMAILTFIMVLMSHNFVELLCRFHAFADLGRFSTELAHEIRTPLQVIEGTIHRGECSEPMKQEIHVQTERIARFLKEILAFGRQERQKISRVQIRDLVEYSVGLIYKAVPAQHGIQLKEHYSEEALWVEGDADQLIKAFSNLVRNGIDSMNGQGTLSVRVARYGFEWLQVEIEDTGVGIEKSELRKIFEPFYTTKAGRRGVGLGLAIAKKFVEANHGQIEVESRVGAGSKFTVRLPLADDAEVG